MAMYLRIGLMVACGIGIGLRLLMTLIPPRYIYSIGDDELRPNSLNSAVAWCAPEHVLSPLGKRLKIISNLGIIVAGLTMAILVLTEWL